MKLKHIAFAIAGMSFSLLANALTPAQIEAARSAGTLQQAWISGATAPTKTIYEAWSRGCNQAQAKSIYTTIAATDANGNPTSNVPGSLGNYVAYACTRGNTPSVLYVTLDGGSLNAYTPHTINAKLARIRYAGTALNTANGCASTTTSYTDATDTRNNATVYKQCKQVGSNLPATGPTPATNAANAAAVAADANAPQLPVGGFSDVEAALFPASIGGGSLAGKGTEANAGLLQGFGVAVSVPLYRKLQEVQGITETSGFDVANAPSLTKAQITTILQDGGAVSAAESWAPIFGADNTGEEAVIVQRRVDTSGTQASSNAFFMGNPCLGNASQLIPAATTSGAYQVVLNSGSGNVKGNITTATTNNRFAIGVLSLENDYRVESAANAGYRFIKIDGVHPEDGDTTNARVAMASGKYPFAMELKTFVSSNPVFGAANSFARTIVPTLATALKNPAAAQCALLPRGIALTADGGNTSCEAGVTRAVLTKFGKNCAPAVLFE
ncbi:hypothetical protein [Methylophilus methylotrophus]|uniref:hypothetical protein n=1 Tax=Methylophilus methylotrophus TaxID=17 RepID=UPI00039A2201|nr:hypothetical protein [Methylophilus methylotrophus]